jgi:serine/threonine-protein kinase PknK
MARALGRRSSEQTARVNLANLALECGDLEEARALLDALAAEPLAPAIAAARLRYAFELELLSGRAAEVRRELGARLGRDHDDPGERAELCVLCAEAEQALGLFAAARERLASLKPDTLPSLSVRALLVRAAAEREEGRTAEARALLDDAHARAEREGLFTLLPRVELALALLYDATDAPSLADEQRRRARVRWERMALELPAGLRARFWEHPQRRDLRREPVLEQGDAASLSRVIELSRRINAQRTIDDVLSFALDAALELTRAERGFVLLKRADEPSCSVRAARRVTEAALERGPRGFSRSIAERVVGEGEPVVTLDAARDPRFHAQASVHALGLSAVLCVPILGAKGLRGALYLDHRYANARFSEQHLTLATALAEQVAVALANAALIAELGEKQRELVRKQRRVEELLADREREVASLSAALARVASERGARTRYPEIVGDGAAMQRLFGVLDRIVDASFPVLVLGESGTGKELVARALHSHGPRASGPFVAINCGALPETLLESELFGHVRGAFTGADRDKPGLFVSAQGGTLFLDEVGELSLPLQVKLLRVLSEGRVRPLGGTRELPVDARVVAATHRNLRARVAEGSFREDLFYRLSVIELVVPPLRERSEDVLPIAEALLARSARAGEAPKRLAPDAARALLRHRFPGNVRELENALLRASALAEGSEIHAADLALDAPAPGKSQGLAAPRSRTEHEERSGEAILAALRKEEWNVSRAARLLGMPRNTLYRKLARMGVAAPERAKGRPRSPALKGP